MVALRDDVVIDILAHLARQGLRCPQGTKRSLLKLWMIMDLPTTAERQNMLRDRGIFKDQDLLNMQLFFIKLGLHFSDPIYGPENNLLLELVMGQRSLYALWEMLFARRYRNLFELLQLKIRYDLGFTWSLSRLAGFNDPTATLPEHRLLGVPANEIGRVHLEHFGERGTVVPRLKRPTELVAREATRRQLALHDHTIHFLLWGHVDQQTGQNLAPTEDEIWMHNAEYKNRAVDTSLEYTRFHIARGRWYDLTEDERRKVVLAQEVREDRVNRWDEHRYDDPRESDAFNVEANATFREIFSQKAGYDEAANLRVDADMNEIPVDVPAGDIPGPLTAALLDAEGHESDNSSDDSSVEFTSPGVSFEGHQDLEQPWAPNYDDLAANHPRNEEQAYAEAAEAAEAERRNSEAQEEVIEEEDLTGEVSTDEEDSDEAEEEDDDLWDFWPLVQNHVNNGTVIADHNDSDADAATDDAAIAAGDTAVVANGYITISNSAAADYAVSDDDELLSDTTSDDAVVTDDNAPISDYAATDDGATDDDEPTSDTV